MIKGPQDFPEDFCEYCCFFFHIFIETCWIRGSCFTAGLTDQEKVTMRSLLLRRTLCLPVSSADNRGKQFGPRSGPMIHLA